MNMSEACNVATDLSKNIGFIVEIVAVLGLAPLGCFLNACVIYCILKTTIFHANLRILLSHLSFLSCFYCFAVCTKYLYVAFVMASNPCDSVTDLRSCKIQDLFYILPLGASAYSLLGIGVERIYAAFSYRNYENKKHISLSVVIIASVWTVSLGVQTSPIPNITTVLHLPVCHNVLAANKEAALVSLLGALCFEILSVLIFVGTTLLDKHRSSALLINRAKHSLADRFQLSQNIEMNRIMLPTAVAHCTFYIPIIAIGLFVVVGTDEWLLKIRIGHLTFIGAELYTIGHALIIFGRNERLRQQLCKLFSRFPGLLKLNAVKPKVEENNKGNDSDKYFAYLDELWSKKIDS